MDCRHHDPFTCLGRKEDAGHAELVIYRPDAEHVYLLTEDAKREVPRQSGTDFFIWEGAIKECPDKPRLLIDKKDKQSLVCYDPYSFMPVLSEQDLNSFHSEEFCRAHKLLGARPLILQGIRGICFSVWAPNAERVSVVGDFNSWDGRIHQMRSRGYSGVWEIFLTDIPEQSYYKFEIRNKDTGAIHTKADPYAWEYALRPDTASVIRYPETMRWRDQGWMTNRRQMDWMQAPFSIYELHLGSWRRDENGYFLNYRELAHQLVEYVQAMGFTHIQLLPVTEHPFDASWGYQVTGYFAPTSRFGILEDFKYFVDYCHINEIGVLLDWVPGHFPRDDHALANFDGTALYEHGDPNRGEHKDWGTLIFNYGRNEVRNFLLSSAYYWLEEFHIDGLRVDAVASMLYLDYSREEGEWTPNQYGGNENLEAIDFLKKLNTILHEQFPGALVVAEESTSWPGVSHPVYAGGLGFSMKWNMGWMNDTLRYVNKEPVYRSYHHEDLTFGLLYAFTENFMLPLSHDEVVHGKGSILNKMPGDPWQQFANVRLLYSYMYAYPGKKLLFMGNEFAQGKEWDCEEGLEWYLLDYPFQQGVQSLVKDLNRIYRKESSFHKGDFRDDGFEWIDCHNHVDSVISYMRCWEDEFVLVVLNFTPVVRQQYRVGVPDAGTYYEIFNSDSIFYNGSNISNGTEIHSQSISAMGRADSVELDLPPLGAVFLKKR